MSAELGLSKAQMGDVFSAFVLGYVLFEIPGGWLADRYGARALLTRIVLWWSAFTALTGFAWSYASLLVMRFLFGCGEAGAFPGCASAISRWFPFAERGRAQATIMVGSRIGAAFAPGLVIALMALVGWRPVFWIFAGLGVVWAAAWAGWYRNTPEEHAQVRADELATIRQGRQLESHAKADWGALLRSRNVWMLSLMYSGYTWGAVLLLDLAADVFAGGPRARLEPRRPGRGFALPGRGRRQLDGRLADRPAFPARSLCAGRGGARRWSACLRPRHSSAWRRSLRAT